MTASATGRLGRRRGAIPERRRLALAGVGLVALALATRFVVSVLINAPAWPSTLPVEALEQLTTGLAALAAGVLGATADDPLTGIGLLFVGVFGLLALVVGLAVPAAVAVVAGTVLIALGRRADLTPTTGAATGLLVAGLAVSLTGGLGLASLRPLGSTLALLALAATPVFAATDARALVGGVVAFAAVALLGLTYPFLTGAVTLVGSGVIGTSLPVVALAVAGAVTTTSAALRQRRWGLLAGVALLALAGVPATLERAVPVALGIATLLTLEGGR